MSNEQSLRVTSSADIRPGAKDPIGPSQQAERGCPILLSPRQDSTLFPMANPIDNMPPTKETGERDQQEAMAGTPGGCHERRCSRPGVAVTQVYSALSGSV